MLFEMLHRALTPSKEFKPPIEDRTFVTTGLLLPYLSITLIVIWTSAIWDSFSRIDHSRPNTVLRIDMGVIAASSLASYFSYPTTAVCISLAAMIWTRIPGSLLGLSSDLPSLKAFLSSLQPLATSPNHSGHSTEEAEDEGDERVDHCLICWETERASRLPCTHLLCRSCILTMAKSHKSCCPYCQRPLFQDRSEWGLSLLWNTTLAIMFVTAFLHLLTVILLLNRRRFLAVVGPACQMVGMTGTSLLWAYIAHKLGAQWWRFFFENALVAKFPRLLVASAYFGHFATNFVRAAMQTAAEDWQVLDK